MDPLTQGLLGAALPQALAGRRELRAAAATGFVAGMLADLDVLIRSAKDPLLGIEYHRHFTHALAFVPLGGLAAAALLWPLLRRHLGFARLWAFATLGYATHGLLDAFTSYGTRLLWPFSGARVAWDVVAVIDPLFTLPLAVFVALSVRRRSAKLARLGLAVGAAYLLLGVVQRERAEAAVRAVAAERGHAAERLTVKPTLFNLIVWRSIYQAQDRFFVDAVRVGAGAAKVYPGESASRFRPEALEPGLVRGSTLERDLARFVEFSDGWVAQHPDDPAVIGDLRYAVSPAEIAPLWGIRLEPERQEQHAPLEHFREVTAERRQAFVRMLFAPAAVEASIVPATPPPIAPEAR